MKNIVGVILRGLITITILAVESVWGTLKGLWGESDRMARLFLISVNPNWHSSLYWVFRIFAFFMQLIILMVFFNFLYHIVGRYLHLW